MKYLITTLLLLIITSVSFGFTGMKSFVDIEFSVVRDLYIRRGHQEISEDKWEGSCLGKFGFLALYGKIQTISRMLDAYHLLNETRYWGDSLEKMKAYNAVRFDIGLLATSCDPKTGLMIRDYRDWKEYTFQNLMKNIQIILAY